MRVEIEGNIIIAHARLDGVEWPVVTAKLEIEPGPKGAEIVLAYSAEYGPTGETPEAAQKAHRLKQLIAKATMQSGELLFRLEPGRPAVRARDWACRQQSEVLPRAMGILPRRPTIAMVPPRRR